MSATFLLVSATTVHGQSTDALSLPADSPRWMLTGRQCE